MPFVRQRGKQILLLHGERHPETRAVEQRVLYTIRSRTEAEAIVTNDTGASFRSLMEHHHPDLRFDWKRLTSEIKRHARSLPSESADDGTTLSGGFRAALCEFVRQLDRNDPQLLDTAAAVVDANRADLEYVGELIRWRLDVPRRPASEFTRDDRFHWRYVLHGAGVPPEAEERLGTAYERGDFERVNALARLLIDAYPGYAEGHNYLGLVALRRGDLTLAEAELRACIAVARKSLPAKVRRSSWWRDHETRPYMRGLRNLAITLTRASRWDDAERVARQLADECDDRDSSDAFIARIALSTGRYREAFERASRLRESWAAEGFVAALAAAELSDGKAALEAFLHAALHQPNTAQLIVRGRVPPDWKTVGTREDARGPDDVDDLHAYLAKRRAAVRRRFEPILDDPRVAAVLRESADVQRRWFSERQAGDDRRLFDRMTLLRDHRFAVTKAREWADLVAETPRGTVH